MIKDVINRLSRFEDIDESTSYEVMKYIMEKKATDVQIAAFLMALKMKGEAFSEISGFSRAMLDNAKIIKIDRENAVDTCGTGGDCKNTFNISTTAAFIAAGAGVLIAKHGNRGLSSKSGSADVLEALGVHIYLSADDVAECIKSIGIGFMFAPLFHSATASAAKARKEMGIKSVFNILGPLTNPAMAKGRVLGVYDKKLIETVGNTLKKIGVRRAFVVCGDDGMDEFSVCSANNVAELRDDELIKYILDPSDLGFKLYQPKELIGGSPKQNANILINILNGKEKGAKMDAALLNAAAAIVVGKKAQNLKEGIALSKQSIDSGSALKKLKELIDFTKKHQSKE